MLIWSLAAIHKWIKFTQFQCYCPLHDPMSTSCNVGYACSTSELVYSKRFESGSLLHQSILFIWVHYSNKRCFIMPRLFDAAFINTSALKCGVYSTAVFNRINTVLLRKLFKEERTKISVFHISPASLPLKTPASRPFLSRLPGCHYHSLRQARTRS